MKLQKIDAAKEYYQRKVDFLTQQMEKLQSVLREKYDMKEGTMMRFCKLMTRDHSFPGQIFPNSAGKFAKFCSSPRQIFHIWWLIFYGPLNPTKYAIFVAGNCNWLMQSVYHVNWQYFRQAQLNIFNISPVIARVAVMCFMVKSCLHTIRQPELNQICRIWPLITGPSTEFRKIPSKHRNSVDTGKFHSLARNSAFHGKLGSPIDDCHRIT